MNHKLPPVIRVFISSTFSDMERERSCFNEVISRKIRTVCAERGLSFFTVDLRWGITEEEQLSGRVLPICLNEIDKCRPFFIGILGNRYGSTLQAVSPEAAVNIPWLKGMEGKSITEIEMLYAVLDKENSEISRDCAFYIRDEKLSEEWYGKEEKSTELELLINRVCSDEDLVCSHYSSVEEFAELVIRDIRSWLDKEFPCAENVAETRRDWYSGELKRGYITSSVNESFMNEYFRNSERSLVVFGKGSEGKTSFLNNWEPNGEKILINCGSDIAFSRQEEIAFEIIRQMKRIDPSIEVPEISEDITDERKRRRFIGKFFRWLSDVKPSKEVFIILNDLNLLEAGEGRYLSWLPVKTDGNIHIVCSVNDEAMEEIAEIQGRNIKRIDGFSKETVREYISSYLGNYGKSVTAAQLDTLGESEIFSYPGLARFALDFLIEYASFESLTEYIELISECKSGTELYAFAYDKLTSELSEKEKAAVTLIFGITSEAVIPLSEQECFSMAEEHTKITPVEWAKIRSIFELFRVINGEYWIIREKNVKLLCEVLFNSDERQIINLMLGEHLLGCLEEKDIEKDDVTDICKAVITNYSRCKEKRRLLKALKSDKVIRGLCFKDFRYLRTGWAELFLSFDMELSGEIMNLVKSYNDSGEEKISDELAGLLNDLEYRLQASRLRMRLKRDFSAGSIKSLTGNYSRDFAEFHDYLVDLKRKYEFRKITEIIENADEKLRNMNDDEKCHIFFLKTDALQNQGIGALEAVNEYYIYAVRSGNMYEIQCALRMRAEELNKKNESEEALELVEKAIAMAREDGDIRGYLAGLNLKGRCLYKIGKSEEGIEILETAAKYWRKLGNLVEVSKLKLNICNGLHHSGKIREAYDEAKKALGEIEKNKERSLIQVSILFRGNIARYAYNLEMYEEAISLASEVEKEASGAGLESVFFNALSCHKDALEKLGKITEAAEVLNNIIGFLVMRNRYAEAYVEIKSLEKLLNENGYPAYSDKIIDFWKKEFSKIPDGMRYFEGCEDKSGDSHKITELKENLAMAVSTGDMLQVAKAAHLLGVELSFSDVCKAAEYHIMSAEAYKKCGMEKEYNQKLCDGGVCLFSEKRIADEKLLEKILDAFTEDEYPEVFRIWRDFYEMKDTASFARKIVKLVGLYEKNPFGVFRCLCDNSRMITAALEPDAIILISELLEENQAEAFKQSICFAVTERAPEDIAELMENFKGERADGLMKYYSRNLKLLEEFKSKDYYAICGNVGLIYFKRKEREKAIHYHEIARDGFKSDGSMRDYYIEILNLANAYHRADEKKEAEEIYRKGLKELENSPDEFMRANFAGNLVSVLISYENPENNDEIMKLFVIEESSFRNSGAYKDLVISLLNQVTFLYYNGYDKEKWMPKVLEAEKYAVKYELGFAMKKIYAFKIMAEEKK